MAPRNAIWDFFEKKLGKAKCYACNKLLSLGSDIPKKQTITNIQKHLEKVHPEEWEKYNEIRASQVSEVKVEHPEKKWTNDETIELLQYLAEAGEFETPNAEEYYKTAVEEISIDATWQAVRKRVRQLKRLFNKAIIWRNSEEAKACKVEEMQKKILQICPYFNRLNLIFGSGSDWPQTEKEESLSICEDEYMEQIARTEVEIPTFECIEFSGAVNNSSANTSRASNRDAKMRFSINDNQYEAKSAITLLDASMQSKGLREIFPYESERILELEERSLKLQEDKFQLEKHIRIAELELKKEEMQFRKLQLQQDERIRRLEVEKQTRIAKYELELKYKYGVHNNG